MKFGVVLPSYGPQAGRLAILDTALAAESLGFDSVWLTDHLALPEEDAGRFGTIIETITGLAYLAASTRSVRLGISALVLPQRNPVEVAKQIATVDVLSGGRVVLALGIGWSAGEYRNLGYDFANRAERMDEAIKVLRSLWRGSQTVSFQGKYYRFENVHFAPGCVQAGGPEIFVAGNSPAALRRGILLADGWHPDSLPLPDLRDRLGKAAPLLRNRPFTVSMRMRVEFETQAEPAYLSGSSAEVTAQIRALQEAGLTHAVLSFQAESIARRQKAMQVFAREVLPAFR